jgi:hypothetical protein
VSVGVVWRLTDAVRWTEPRCIVLADVITS